MTTRVRYYRGRWVLGSGRWDGVGANQEMDMKKDRIGRTTREQHRLSKTPEYRAWQGMIDRCFHPANQIYHRYGGRGIIVCDEWRASFQAFYAHMGPRPSTKHSIERLNNDGNYEPGNCAWATIVQQNRNTSLCVYLEYKGDRMTTTEWADRIGLPRQMLSWRIKKGWSIERTLTTPGQRIGRAKIGRQLKGIKP